MRENDFRRAWLALPGVPAELLHRLAKRAGDAGLVDISYGEMDSPLGILVLAVTERGLVQLSYADSDPGALESLAHEVSPRIMRRPGQTDRARRQLDEYFNGKRRDFDTPLDWTLIQGFRRKVLVATAAIPFGQVSTYRAVATEAGNAQASRAAGNALGANPIPIIIPCHRVLRTGGGFGGYTGGLHRKEHLLALEGVGQGRLPRL